MAPSNEKPKKDQISGVETTGHEWDGLQELNNPAPRWWLWLLYATIAWAAGYWVFYPAWPTIENATLGRLGWTSHKQLAESQEEIRQRQAAFYGRLQSASLEEIRQDPELFEFARRGGEGAFKNSCAACHGTGAAARSVYPNLNDDDWLWGGKLEDIYASISYGIRSGHDKARFSAMPAFGTDGILKPGEVAEVTGYVLSLSGKAEANEKGAAIFQQQCASCHGKDGKGDRSVGAPNLADAIWLYGGDEAAVSYTISRARNGVMPSWQDKLDDEVLKQLAIYVHSLGGGE